MKRLATTLSDFIPLALTVIFVIAVVLTLSHVTYNPVAAMNKATSTTKQVCPSAVSAQAAQNNAINEAVRSGELDRYISSEVHGY